MLLNLLFKATAEVMKNWSNEQGFAPGFCSVLHTFGGVLNVNTHIHLLFTGGGLGSDGTLTEIDFIPWSMLKKRFRAILIKMLRTWVKENVLHLPKSVVGMWQRKRGVSDFRSLLSSLFSVTWYVYVGEKLKNADYTVTYIGRYAKRPCIAEAKIRSYDGETVVFVYKDKIMKEEAEVRLSAEEFIGRLIRHIPEKGFRMIRYYGVYANRSGEKYMKLRKLVKERYGSGRFQFAFLSLRTWRERVIKHTGEDPLVCPRCKKELVLTEVAYRARDGTGLRIVRV